MHGCDGRCSEKESNDYDYTKSHNDDDIPEVFDPEDPEEVDTSKSTQEVSGNKNSNRGFASSTNFKGKKCIKDFPKDFVKHTQLDKNGFPKYKRTPEADGGHVCFKNGKKLDNSRVVPYNALLSKVLNCH